MLLVAVTAEVGRTASVLDMNAIAIAIVLTTQNAEDGNYDTGNFLVAVATGKEEQGYRQPDAP